MKFEKTLILFGIILRIYLFILNPPNNTYDDHLEVINKYSLGANVKLEECWECYQPPLFYAITSKILNTFNHLGFTDSNCWKAVQGFNLLLTICVLLIFVKLLINEGIKPLHRLLFISLWIVFPRDLMASIMITNDYALVFLTTLIIYFVSHYYKENICSKRWWKLYIIILILSGLGGFVKQSGIVLLFIPGLITLRNLIIFKNFRKQILVSFLLLFIICLSLIPEYINYTNGYKFLVSAQDFMTEPLNQYPGNINMVEFSSIKYIELLKTPFLNDVTSYSFNTNLFASSWFDYDQKYTFPSFTSNFSAQAAYTIGLIWILFFASLIIIKIIKLKYSDLKITILNFVSFEALLACMFIIFYFVPLLQTLRYPFFSSMKAQFLLPAVPATLILLAKIINEIALNKKIIGIGITLNLILIVLICFSFYEGITYGLNIEHNVILFDIPKLK